MKNPVGNKVVTRSWLLVPCDNTCGRKETLVV